MPQKEHLRLLGDKQLSEIGAVKFNYGAPQVDDERTIELNYYYIANGLDENLSSFERELIIKQQQRLPEIEVPTNIDYIRITFHDQFNIEKYYTKWYDKFGLEGVSFRNFNRNVLFAIVDIDKFKIFISDLKAFISFGLNRDQEARYSKLLLYIKEFALLTTSEIIRFRPNETGDVVILKTIDLPLDLPIEESLLSALEVYLKAADIDYEIDKENDKIELYNPTYDQLILIASHFDIIESITCSISGIVRPSDFNLPVRDFGFEISNVDEDLPLIGIMDTGISMETPLKSITLEDRTFTLDGSDPLIDVAGRNANGHGTAVAGLAALGRTNHLNNFEGNVRADAKLLSLKLSNSGNGYFSEKKIITMLYEAKAKYPEMRLFVLTMVYGRFMANNESYSTYTNALDKFAFETDSLIFICTGNNNSCINENTSYDLAYFNSEHTNLCTPADSMNNMTVGASAEGLNSGEFRGISDGREYPALYTRKSHIDLKSLYPKNKSNKNLFKPDVIECGGDLGFYNSTTLDWIDEPAMSVLSAKAAVGFIKETGTSLSTPLAANLAAKILKLYPNLKSQTIKALIINGASLNEIRFQSNVSELLSKTAGNGFINLEKTLYSNENSATIILEDTIDNESQKLYPINFPKYLIEDDLGKKNRILKISATLCFSFLPIQHNQLSYCPIHLAFSVFKNHDSDEINTKKDEINSLLRSNLTWSQTGRHKAKPIPYSNSQKFHFNIDINQLKNESLTFKLAVQARLSSQILQSEFDNYTKEYPFSIVLRIEENIPKPKNKLYDEIQLINNLEIIGTSEAEGTLEAEA